jgi:hypothetical protein
MIGSAGCRMIGSAGYKCMLSRTCCIANAGECVPVSVFLAVSAGWVLRTGQTIVGSAGCILSVHWTMFAD